MRHKAPEYYYPTCVRRGPSGLHNTWLILGGEAFDNHTLPEDESLSLTLTGTNGQLPRRALQSTVLDTVMKSTSASIDVHNLCAPRLSCYSRKLIQQVQYTWPERAKPLAQTWHQQLNAAALPTEQLNGWHQGMMKLKQLSEQLNGLDKHKWKYSTVSELKSQMFAATQLFNKTVPVEEQLRQMSIQEKPEMIPYAQKIQTEQHLKQLNASFSMTTAGSQSCQPHQLIRTLRLENVNSTNETVTNVWQYFMKKTRVCRAESILFS